MAQISARGIALDALAAWRTKKQFADAIISNALLQSKLEPADRGFAVELFYGVLRNLTLLDFWIALLRTGHIEASLRDTLRLGIYQLLIAKTAEHAAVNETVGLAAKRQRSIANAILRSAARRRAELLGKASAQPLDVRKSHPNFLIERWNKQFGAEDTKALCDWNNQPPRIYARINGLKIDRDSFLGRYPNAQPLPGLSRFVELASPGAALEAGDCYVQDPSTIIACELLAPQPGERILDACAAPGGKTIYLAELMQNRGLLIGCDRDPERLQLLNENLERLGVRIASSVRHDWMKTPISNQTLAETQFDRILIDAPCSNTGVMRRRVDVRWRLKPGDFVRMQERQIAIVRALLPLLKPGGTLVYSTCSLEPEENEQIIAQLAGLESTLRLEEQRSSLPFRDGFDGAFAARFRRTS